MHLREGLRLLGPCADGGCRSPRLLGSTPRRERFRSRPLGRKGGGLDALGRRVGGPAMRVLQSPPTRLRRSSVRARSSRGQESYGDDADAAGTSTNRWDDLAIGWDPKKYRQKKPVSAP